MILYLSLWGYNMRKLILMGLMACSLMTSTVNASDMKHLGNFKLTFYCPCRKCSGPYGHQTSSGAYATEGRTIAVDNNVIPKGARVYIEGWGEYVAEDTGGPWVKGNHIDIFNESHKECLDDAHGIKYAEVYLIK